jgi:hypothetical protein
MTSQQNSTTGLDKRLDGSHHHKHSTKRCDEPLNSQPIGHSPRPLYFARMNREELLAAARREGIRDSAYALDGGPPGETYVLAIMEGGWTVYYSERGKRVDETFFDTEDEACSFMLLKLVSDPTTRHY